MRPPRRQAGGPRRRRRGAIPRGTRATARAGAWRRTITSAISAAPMVRVRFAPSPTGYLHIGGARTALFNWLWARKNKGVFVLRVEDTDQSRSTQESEQAIINGMKWLGLDWDEGPIVGGPHAPYFQMQRLATYDKHAEDLIAKGKAYRCDCTKEELERLSKRHGAVNVLQYRDDGYLPGALVNYLARLGWSHGDQEIFTIPELIEKFDWEHVGANAGVFNPQKLEWLNQQWIKMTPAEEIAKQTGVSAQFAALMQERARNLNEIRDAWRAYMTAELPAYDDKAVAKQLTQEARPLLVEARTLIDRTFPQGPQAMEHAFRALAEQRGLGVGKVAQPVRVAVTGTTVSPPLFETIALLGKERTLRRIDAALEKTR